MKKSQISPFIAIMLSFLMLLSSCFPPKKTVVTVPDEQSQNVSGQQMFREILFLEGSLKTNIPSHINKIYNLENQSPKEITARKEITDNIISMIDKKDSKFFKYFKISILSDNPFEINKAVQLGSDLIIASLNLSKENELLVQFIEEIGSKYDFSNEQDVKKFNNEIEEFVVSNNMADTFEVAAGNQTCVAVAGVIALAGAIAVAGVVVFVKFWLWEIKDSDISNSLELEMFIKEIIVNY